MARKPNYRFERMERERLRAERKLERKKAKEERPPDPTMPVQPPGNDLPAHESEG